jgi:hypothetical protein
VFLIDVDNHGERQQKERRQEDQHCFQIWIIHWDTLDDIWQFIDDIKIRTNVCSAETIGSNTSVPASVVVGYIFDSQDFRIIFIALWEVF